MFDDPGDLDRNGIPDSIQLDPVVVPEDPFVFGEPVAETGLPGIDSPITAVGDASAEPMPEPPVAPTPPPPDADEATLLRYQQALQHHALQMDMLSKLIQAKNDMQKGIISNFRV